MGRPSERRKFLLVRGRQMLHIKPRNEIQSYGYWSYSEAFPVMEDKTVPITYIDDAGKRMKNVDIKAKKFLIQLKNALPSHLLRAGS